MPEKSQKVSATRPLISNCLFTAEAGYLHFPFEVFRLINYTHTEREDFSLLSEIAHVATYLQGTETTLTASKKRPPSKISRQRALRLSIHTLLINDKTTITHIFCVCADFWTLNSLSKLFFSAAEISSLSQLCNASLNWPLEEQLKIF